MKKAKRLEVEPPQITRDIFEALCFMQADGLRDAARDLNSAKSSQESCRETIRSLMHDVQSYKERIRQIEEYVENYDMTPYQENANEVLRNISKLRYIESIKMRDGHFLVRTRLMFTKVRESSGSRKYYRRCIGAFDIKIDLDRRRLWVRNTLFTNMTHQHWSINREGSCCWGEWEEQFQSFLQRRDLYNLLVHLQPYILSTDDAAAYTPSNRWIEQRQASLYGRRLRKCAYVILSEDVTIQEEFYDEDDNSQRQDVTLPKGTKALVTGTDRSNLNIDIGEPFGPRARQEWYVSKAKVVPIKKSEFEDDSVILDDMRQANLSELDQLLEGSTLADGKTALAS